MTQGGEVTSTFKMGVTHASISKSFEKALFDEDQSSDSYVFAEPGTVISLVGHIAFPCVCEVPPSCAPLFSEAGARTVSQGITWQSLYLVILGYNLVLAEPERRYIISCFYNLFDLGVSCSFSNFLFFAFLVAQVVMGKWSCVVD